MPGSLADLFGFISQLMTQNADLFESMGLRLFRAFAVLMISWFGIKSALSSASSSQVSAFHFDHFAGLVLSIAFGYAMITYYSRPIPGIGISFYHLFTDQGLALANKLDNALFQDVWGRLTGLYWGMETPGLTITLNVLEIIRYVVVLVLIAVALAAVYTVSAFGYVAVAIAVLIGPLFIPFFLIPDLNWIFWGWFRALLQYSFYPVVANAYVFVFGNLIIHFVDSHPPPWDGALILILFFPLVVMLLAFTYGVIKIPSLVNSLFTGRSGESGYPSL